MNISIEKDTIVVDGVLYVKQQAPKPNPKRIDWSKMPKGVWVEGRYFNSEPFKKYRLYGLNPYNQLCNVQCINGERACVVPQIRLIEQPEVTFWPGGECPVPEGLRVEIHFRDGEVRDDAPHPEKHYWGHDKSETDIIGYRILGVAEGWTS